MNKSLDLCLACLQLLLRRNHPNERFLLPRLIALITEARNIKHVHDKQNPLEKSQWLGGNKEEFNLPPLLFEMWSSD